MKRVVIACEIIVVLIFTVVQALPQFCHETLEQTYLQCPGSSSMILAMGLARLGDPLGQPDDGAPRGSEVVRLDRQACRQRAWVVAMVEASGLLQGTRAGCIMAERWAAGER